MEIKFVPTKTGYNIFRFEAGPEGKRAKVNKKIAGTVFDESRGKFSTIFFDCAEDAEKEEVHAALIEEEKAWLKEQLERVLQSSDPERLKEIAEAFLEIEETKTARKALGEVFASPAPEPIQELGEPETLPATANKNKILIVVEGETEKIYFREVCASLGLSEDLVKVQKGRHNDPYSLVEECAKELLWSDHTGGSLDHAWAVFDRDGHMTFDKAFEFVKDNPRIHICWSNPCFEIWFLLHYLELPCGLSRRRHLLLEKKETKERVSPGHYKITVEQIIEELFDSEEALERLREVYPAYKKNSPAGYFAHLSARYESAFRRLNVPEPDPHTMGTTVPKLIDDLEDWREEFAAKPSKEADAQSINMEEEAEEDGAPGTVPEFLQRFLRLSIDADGVLDYLALIDKNTSTRIKTDSMAQLKAPLIEMRNGGKQIPYLECWNHEAEEGSAEHAKNQEHLGNYLSHFEGILNDFEETIQKCKINKELGSNSWRTLREYLGKMRRDFAA